MHLRPRHEQDLPRENGIEEAGRSLKACVPGHAGDTELGIPRHPG